jgi:signal transduction histidine kinase
MSQSYSDDDTSAAARDLGQARELIGRLLPGADAGLLFLALDAERAVLARVYSAEAPSPEAPVDPAADRSARELQRVRRQYALGATARTAQHELNNPLTALLAEAQLLQLEPMSEEHRAAIGRIVALARRIAAVARKFSGGEAPTIG